jgi:hypothetical protein
MVGRPWFRRAVCIFWAATAAVFGAVSGPAQSQASTARAPVLGSRAFMSGGGVGWGTYKPRHVFNGGDPSGDVLSITWSGWGSSAAYGVGQGSIFKPGGGYYPRLVRVELRARSVGRCSDGGPLAYRQLAIRVPSRPGGPFGKWLRWGNAESICRNGT